MTYGWRHSDVTTYPGAWVLHFSPLEEVITFASTNSITTCFFIVIFSKKYYHVDTWNAFDVSLNYASFKVNQYRSRIWSSEHFCKAPWNIEFWESLEFQSDSVFINYIGKADQENELKIIFFYNSKNSKNRIICV